MTFQIPKDEKTLERLSRALKQAGAVATREAKLRYIGEGVCKYTMGGQELREWYSSWYCLVEGPEDLVRKIQEVYENDPD
jgi:hypothetical protein